MGSSISMRNVIKKLPVYTAMLDDFLGDWPREESYARFVSTVPLGRLSTPRDMANAALYLASDEADFITGVMLEVDGGRCV